MLLTEALFLAELLVFITVIWCIGWFVWHLATRQQRLEKKRQHTLELAAQRERELEELMAWERQHQKKGGSQL